MENKNKPCENCLSQIVDGLILVIKTVVINEKHHRAPFYVKVLSVDKRKNGFIDGCEVLEIYDLKGYIEKSDLTFTRKVVYTESNVPNEVRMWI